jgi:2-keto-4-pentenoate hydratase/2-oxohepta-3-ene-1,7-dioic acid hydratase in catechol pathway
MKLLTFAYGDSTRLGAMLEGGRVLDLTQSWQDGQHPDGQPAPIQVLDVIKLGEEALAKIRNMIDIADSSGAQLLDAEAIDILAPIPRPTKNVFCVGRNYRAHIVEGNLARGRAPDDFPKAIELFTKPPTAVVGHRASVSRHARLTKLLDYEIELGIVIGKPGRDISVEDALEHVFGYTIVNDITARDLQTLHGQWFKGKALDGTCPIGPVITVASAISDPDSLDLSLSVNGEIRQSANTSDLLFDIRNVIAEISAGMTLEPGDIIATGTPSGVGMALNPPRSLEPGDVISARIESIGELVTTII